MKYIPRYILLVVINFYISHLCVHATNSVFKTGTWYKFKVSETGIYSLTYEEINKDLGYTDPTSIAIYGLEGGMLDDVNDGTQPTDVQEIPLFFIKGSDGIFNKGDQVIFYLKGPTKWTYSETTNMFEHQKHDYSDYAYYFVSDIKKGKEIQKNSGSSSTVTHTVNSFIDFAYHEQDDKNFIQSGREWYGEEFYLSTLSYTFGFAFSNLIKDQQVKLAANVLSRSDGNASFKLIVNDKLVNTYTLGNVSLKDYTGLYAQQKKIIDSCNVNSDNVDVSLEYIVYNQESKGYLDYISVNAARNLIISGNQMEFRDIASVGMGNVSKFIVQGMTSDYTIWETTDFYDIREVQGNLNGSAYEFIVNTDSLRQFIAFKSEDFLKPVLKDDDIGLIENQNLHGISSADYLIVSHSMFINYANELAEVHQKNSGLSVIVVDQEKIFNEFSSGTRDICAIRNFVKMFYDRTDQKKPRYLLLFGDGSFDNKHFDENNYNFILTYQSLNSLEPLGSFVSDDFYGFLDDNEEILSGNLDIGIGRFPVKDTSQARVMVNKVKTYLNEDTWGDWRNSLCFIGDDDDGNKHMDQSNDLSELVKANFPSFNENKIFLDAYKQVSTSNGARYPDVNKAIFNQIQKGALIMNYTGHGAEWGLAHEHVLNNDDINNWSNWGKFPLFITATCEFSRFDYTKTDDKGMYMSTTTTGENVVLYEKGGAIASLTTTRAVYAQPNFELNQSFYQYIFALDTLYGQRNRLGDVVRLSKNSTEADKNNRNFVLLGDPALILSYPEHIIKIDSINHVGISIYKDCQVLNSLYNNANTYLNYLDSLCTYHDTLCSQADSVRYYADSLSSCIDSICASVNSFGALSFINITGHIEKKEGEIYSDFNGELYTTIFDKPENITTLDNDQRDRTFEFELQNNIIFKGKASVDNGYFSFSFLVPKDIAYIEGNGKISCYAYNKVTDASGWDTALIIGGFDDFAEIDDNEGPEIQMYMNNTYYKEEGITNESPVLLAYLSDKSGINTTTSGIGHEMVAVIDNNFSSLFVMNDFYESDINDYKNGKINYPLINLEPGEHSVWIKVWDVLNNSSDAELKFNVIESNKLFIKNVYNYPNPFTTSTKFIVEHNLPDELAEVTIRIFDMSGRLLRTLNSNDSYNGFMSPVIEWDGTSDNGNNLEGGIYLFQVVMSSDKGKAEKSSKMIIIR